MFGGLPRVAYRLRATTDFVLLTWSHSFGAHWTANLSYGYRRSTSDEFAALPFNNDSCFVAFVCLRQHGVSPALLSLPFVQAVDESAVVQLFYKSHIRDVLGF